MRTSRSRRLWFWVLALLAVTGAGLSSSGAAERPNILWITCEDTGPNLGCYGDTYATTPSLDRLAARGLRFRRAWSTAPVCAPARTAIISGMYPSALGAEHMRSLVPMPAGTRMFPELLREAGYYCSNNSKEDYNLIKPETVWDESSARAHWKPRKPGQPFFAVFNFTETHESEIRRRPHTFVHDPARVVVPPYMPDTRETREAWAQYADQVSVVDAKAGALLEELGREGLADDTIVFFYGDHGAGLPRGKRSACDSGLRVPLIVHFPPKWRHLAPKDYREGGESSRLVGFVDLAPTVLSLAGMKPPSWMQGRAIAGRHAGSGPDFLFGLRGRMDERYDLVRAVTDGRFVYVRNYMPHRPHGQHVAYMFQTPATIAWKRLFDAGGLPPAQRAFWEPKAPEELYDLEADPFETRNLAGDPGHRRALDRLRRAHRRHELAIGDVDLLPEADMLSRAAGSAPGDLAKPGHFDARRVFEASELAASRDDRAIPRLVRMASDPDAGVRYWAATGLLIRGPRALDAGRKALVGLLEDPSPSVRVAAAEALATSAEGIVKDRAIDVLAAAADASRNDWFVAVAALNALDNLPAGGVSAERKSALAPLPRRATGVNARMTEYVGRLLDDVTRPSSP